MRSFPGIISLKEIQLVCFPLYPSSFAKYQTSFLTCEIPNYQLYRYSTLQNIRKLLLLHIAGGLFVSHRLDSQHHASPNVINSFTYYILSAFVAHDGTSSLSLPRWKRHSMQPDICYRPVQKYPHNVYKLEITSWKHAYAQVAGV